MQAAQPSQPSNLTLLQHESENVAKTAHETLDQSNQSTLQKIKGFVLSILTKIKDCFLWFAYYIPLHSTHTVKKLRSEAETHDEKASTLSSELDETKKLLNASQGEVSRLEKKLTDFEALVKNFEALVKNLEKEITALNGEKQATEKELNVRNAEVLNFNMLSKASEILEKFEEGNRKTLEELEKKLTAVNRLTKDDQERFVNEISTKLFDFATMKAPENLEAIVDKLTDEASRSLKEGSRLHEENVRLGKEVVDSSERMIRKVLEELKQDLETDSTCCLKAQKDIEKSKELETEPLKELLKKTIEDVKEYRSKLVDKIVKKSKTLENGFRSIVGEVVKMNEEEFKKIDQERMLKNKIDRLEERQPEFLYSLGETDEELGEPGSIISVSLRKTEGEKEYPLSEDDQTFKSSDFNEGLATASS